MTALSLQGDPDEPTPLGTTSRHSPVLPYPDAKERALPSPMLADSPLADALGVKSLRQATDACSRRRSGRQRIEVDGDALRRCDDGAVAVARGVARLSPCLAELGVDGAAARLVEALAVHGDRAAHTLLPSNCSTHLLTEVDSRRAIGRLLGGGLKKLVPT